jgi:hypothetical protein
MDSLVMSSIEWQFRAAVDDQLNLQPASYHSVASIVLSSGVQAMFGLGGRRRRRRRAGRIDEAPENPAEDADLRIC